MKSKVIIFLILITIMSLTSCQNEAKWYPSADVTITNQT